MIEEGWAGDVFKVPEELDVDGLEIAPELLLVVVVAYEEVVVEDVLVVT